MVYHGSSWSINIWGFVGHFQQNDIKLLNPRLSRGRRKKVFMFTTSCPPNPTLKACFMDLHLTCTTRLSYTGPKSQFWQSQGLPLSSPPIYRGGALQLQEFVEISLQASCPGSKKSGQDHQIGGYSKIIWDYIWTVYGADKVRPLKMLELKFFKIAIFYSLTSSSKLI